MELFQNSKWNYSSTYFVYFFSKPILCHKPCMSKRYKAIDSLTKADNNYEYALSLPSTMIHNIMLIIFLLYCLHIISVNVFHDKLHNDFGMLAKACAGGG